MSRALGSPWAAPGQPPRAPTFTLIVLGVEIDGKVVGHLSGHRRDLSAGPDPQTPQPHRLGEVGLEPWGPAGGRVSEGGGQQGTWQTDIACPAMAQPGAGGNGVPVALPGIPLPRVSAWATGTVICNWDSRLMSSSSLSPEVERALWLGSLPEGRVPSGEAAARGPRTQDGSARRGTEGDAQGVTDWPPAVLPQTWEGSGLRTPKQRTSCHWKRGGPITQGP